MSSTASPAPPLPAPPGRRFATPFGFGAALRNDILGLFFGAQRRHGDVVRFDMPGGQAYLLVHPDHVQHVLQDNHRNYWKGRIFARLKRHAGDGLLFSEGELWKRQRKLAQPAFQRQRIAAMDAMMTECAESLVESWEPQAADRAPLEVTHEMSGLTLEIVTRALFGTGALDNSEEFRRSVDVAIHYANHLIYRILPLPVWVPTPRNLRAIRAGLVLRRTLDGIVAERHRRGDEGDDLLAMLIAARDDESHAGMDDTQLRDELVTFINAGHETTATALAWTWYLISRHPEVERRLHAELAEVLGGRLPTSDDLPDLAYTRCVIEESMRLFPPAWGMGRESYEADEIGGYRIEARSGVFLCPYLTHRHPEFWENPEGFDPDRFAPEHSAERPRFAYFPFGGGPRLCIGSGFAMMEMQLVLATIAQRVTLQLVPGHPVLPDPIFTLRPRHGVAMTVHWR